MIMELKKEITEQVILKIVAVDKDGNPLFE